MKLTSLVRVSGILLSSCLIILASCATGAGGDESTEDFPANYQSVVDLSRSACWFDGDSEVELVNDSSTGNTYLRYLPDTQHVSEIVQLQSIATSRLVGRTISSADGRYTGTIIWSTVIRDIGATVSVIIRQNNNGLVYVHTGKHEILGGSFTGVVPTKTSVSFDELPPVPTDYASNLAGKYDLEDSSHKGWKLEIYSKFSLSKNVNSYFNANVADVQYDSADEKYSFLLVHSSQKDATGSISPGITGNEPFINRQGLFWTYVELKVGSPSKLSWSDVWYETPAEAVGKMNQVADFYGIKDIKLSYNYEFYFGNPVKGSDGLYTVDEGVKIGSYSYESFVAKNISWAELKVQIPAYSVPSDKRVKGWWYSTDSITGILTSFQYPITESTKFSSEKMKIYLELEDAPAVSSASVPEELFGSWSNSQGKSLVISAQKVVYEGIEYTPVKVFLWQEGSTYRGRAVELVNGTTHYVVYFNYYFKSNYIKLRPPKEFSGELTSSYDWSIMNSQISKNFTK